MPKQKPNCKTGLDFLKPKTWFWTKVTGFAICSCNVLQDCLAVSLAVCKFVIYVGFAKVGLSTVSGFDLA